MFELTTLEEYSDQALLDEIRRAAAALHGERFTQKKFLQLARVHVTTVRNRFGSWQKALDLAGIDASFAPRLNLITRDAVVKAIKLHVQESPESSPTVELIAQRLGVHRKTLSGKFGAWRHLLSELGLAPVPMGRRYTDEECFENIVELWTYYGRQPNFAELNQPPSNVGSKAYVKRWGGWRPALGAFVRHINQPSSIDTIQTGNNQEPSQNHEAVTTSSSPRSISLSLRYKVLCRDHFRCAICGRSPAKDHRVELHVDHIVPWSKGGQNTEANLRTLCFDCNLGKGDKTEHA